MNASGPIARLVDHVRKLTSRDLGVLAGANLASQLISFVAMPFLARWCSVAEFGIFQLYATTVTVAGLLACGRYDQAVLVAPDDRSARALAILGAGLALFGGALAGALAHFAGPAGGASSWRELAGWAPLLGASVFFTGATAAATQWQVRRANFAALSRGRLVQSIFTVGVQLAAASAGLGSAALIVGDAVGRAAGLAALVGAGGLATRVCAAPPTPELAREYGRFPLISTPSALLNATGFALPVFLLEHFFDVRAVGVFSLLERVMGIPTVLLGQPLSQLFSHRFRTALPEGGPAAVGVIRQTLRSTALLGLPIYATLLAAGPFLFGLVFGPQWRSTGALAQLLVLPYFIGYVVWPIMPALIILNHLRRQLAWDIGRALLMVTTLALVGRQSRNYEHGVIAAIGVMTVMYALHFLITVRAARHHES